tara:strand:- start:7242 stop:7469 length:228 start_codon:yes stop_codon:yes gene_type:complete
VAASETLQLILVRAEDEALITVVSQERYPNTLGKITPPVIVTHDGTDYILNRAWIDGLAYLYHPSKRKSIDDLLD